MKKVLSFIVALTMLCTVFAGVGSVYAAGEPTFKLTSATAKAGDEVTLSMMVENNPGITACAVAIKYPAGLTLTAKATNKNLFSGGAVVVGGNAANNPYKVNWSEDFDNFYENGEFFTVTFKVADDAQPGDYEIVVSYDQADVYNADMEDVVFATVNGVITVEAAGPVYTEKDAEYHGLTTDKTQVAKVLENVDVKNINGEEYKINSAIAFVSAINADADVVEFGTNIYCEGYDGEVRTIKANNPYDVTDDIKGFVAAISSIREANYGKTFTAKAYAKLADGTTVEVEEGATGSYKPAAN